MGTELGGRARRPWTFPQIMLVCIVIFLVFAIVSGTIVAFGARPGDRAAVSRSLFAGGKANPMPADVIASDSARKTAIFADLGTLRAATADSTPVTVVVKPFMPYPADDLAFREELVKKSRSIRAFVLGWFRERTIDEIGKMGEGEVKAALLEGINGLLVLGSISTVYFEEYMVIE